MYLLIACTTKTFDILYTDGNNILDSPLVKHFNDLLERESSERGKDEVSYFDVGNVSCIHLGGPCVLHKKSFLCNTQSLELFPRNLREDFFLKIGILSPKVYTKNVPNIEVCDFIPGPSTASPIKQVIVVLYL